MRRLPHAMLYLLVAVTIVTFLPSSAQAYSDDDRRTLFSACRQGDNATIRRLDTQDPTIVISATDPSTENSNAFQVALGGQHPDTALLIVRIMHAHHHRPIERDQYGENILTHSIWYMPIPIIKELTTGKYALPIDCRNAMGDTPLSKCVTDTRPYGLTRVKYLLSRGAFINAQSNNGNTPLHHIFDSTNVSKAMAMLLVQHGASLTLTNNQGYTPSETAEQFHNAVLARYLDPDRRH